MLIKTKINTEQRYVRITEPNFEEFLNAAFTKFSIPPPSEGVTVYDEMRWTQTSLKMLHSSQTLVYLQSDSNTHSREQQAVHCLMQHWNLYLAPLMTPSFWRRRIQVRQQNGRNRIKMPNAWLNQPWLRQQVETVL